MRVHARIAGRCLTGRIAEHVRNTIIVSINRWRTLRARTSGTNAVTARNERTGRTARVPRDRGVYRGTAGARRGRGQRAGQWASACVPCRRVRVRSMRYRHPCGGGDFDNQSSRPVYYNNMMIFSARRFFCFFFLLPFQQPIFTRIHDSPRAR